MDIFPVYFLKKVPSQTQSKHNQNASTKNQQKKEEYKHINVHNSINYQRFSQGNYHIINFQKEAFSKILILSELISHNNHEKDLHFNFKQENLFLLNYDELTNGQKLRNHIYCLALDYLIFQEAEQRSNNHEEAFIEMEKSGLQRETVLLLQYLDDLNPNRREYGINMLRKRDINILLKELTGFLSSNKPLVVRRTIVDMLGKTKDEIVIPTLCEVLLEDRASIVRIAAAKALGEISR